ncbi:MAG: hypothetical protein FWG61_05470 [Firmicutes bacterium]|nr:hypothetical protein [Bacillota bacterium]
MKLEKVKNTRSKTKLPSRRNLFKKVTAVVVSIAFFIGSYYIIHTASAAATDTITVLRIKAKDGVPAEAALIMDDLEKYDIIRKEYRQEMVLAEDLEDVLEKYTTHYLRNAAILYYDEITIESPRKNEWLYMYLNEGISDKEILSIPFNYLESGGDILTPGDMVRIRVKYEAEEPEENYNSYIEEEENYYRAQAKTNKVEVTAVLFDSIEVTDMLNNKGHSIYEVYREILRYPESERQKLLKSSNFISSIIPKTLVLAATSEQAERYMQYKSSSKGILITLLPRERESTILDQLPILRMEMEIWSGNQKQ